MPDHIHSALAALGMGVIIALVGVTDPVAAHSPRIAPQAESAPAQGTPQRRARPVSFDWRANRPDPATTPPARRSHAAPGRGSYICSAAGSGRMSRCVAR